MNKEQIYDEKINPLMAEIIKLSRENQIPVVAFFDLKEDEHENSLFCETTLLPEPGKCHPVFDFIRAIFYARESTGVNVDKFFMWLMKKVKTEGHGSVYLAIIEHGLKEGKNEKTSA